MENLIINFTPTGMIPTKEMTPHVPISVNEIIDDAVNISHVQDMLNDLDNFIQNSGTTDNLNDVLQSEDGYSAWLDQANVDIYGDLPDDDNTILQSVPIQEFQTLLEAWKDFLEE